MDQTAPPRRRRQDLPQSTRPPTNPATQIARDKRLARNQAQGEVAGNVASPYAAGSAVRQSGPSSGKIKTAKGSIEIIRAKRGDAAGTQDDAAAGADEDLSRHFTVSNVGAGGTLFLKPSRLPPQAYTTAPATPPRTADAKSSSTIWPSGRASDLSYTGWNSRTRGSAYDTSIPVPPLSLANIQGKRRPRSHSFSTVSERDRMRTPTLDSINTQDFQLIVNDQDSTRQRPKSSIDLGDGYLNLRIPHYRLGTPQFSERGTAYLHNSVYTTTTADERSSTWSRAQYDKLQLFPAPPGRAQQTWLNSRQSSPYRNTPRAGSATPTRAAPPTPPTSTSPRTQISPTVYNSIELNANDPSIIRFSPQTGRIVAATPARLIAQLTSPRFLDYALLSDFLLTYRGFLTGNELLELLFARLKWAIADGSDSGRIVRVRTFVALRHWMLNYFLDDFIPDFALRNRFCDLVNQTCHTLQRRPDQVGDLGILGELKKCWRRTCVKYWPTAEPTPGTEDLDIEPGVELESNEIQQPAASLPLALRQDRVGDSHQVAMVSEAAQRTAQKRPFYHRGPDSRVEFLLPRSRTTSVPTIPNTPMSEVSLQVLSCSVPFFKHIKPAIGTKLVGPRPVGSNRNPPIALQQARPAHKHHRNSSFSDALRDERAPGPSVTFNTTELDDTDDTAILAGLVRGLTLQPCPAKLDVVVPSTPVVHFVNKDLIPLRSHEMDDLTAQRSGVSRVVGDVRRALSSRKGPGESPALSHRSGSSSSSRGSMHLRTQSNQERVVPTSAPATSSESRFDALGALVEESYTQALQASQVEREDPNAEGPSPGYTEAAPGAVESAVDRKMSTVTTSSQSIMIVDATGAPEAPRIRRGALPSVSSWSTAMTPAPLLPRPGTNANEMDAYDYFTPSHASKHFNNPSSSGDHRRSSLDGLSDGIHIWPEGLQPSRSAPDMPDRARKSSGVHSPTSVMSPGPNQLRRRPGGDLKAAEHVHELETETRGYSGDTFSTVSRSQPHSGVMSRELSGTHFSGMNHTSQLAGLRSPGKVRDSYSLLEGGPRSPPFMRPSMEADARGFAAKEAVTPGGGIEDALKKLEGTYATPRMSKRASTTVLDDWQRQSRVQESRRSQERDDLQILSPRTDRQGASIYHLSGTDAYSDGAVSQLSDELSTAPVLPRASKITRFPIQDASPPRAVAFVQTDNIPAESELYKVVSQSSAGAKSGTPQGSFLLDDDESLSEVSTELDEDEEENLAVRSFFFDDTGDAEEDPLPLTNFHSLPTPPDTADAPGASDWREIQTRDHVRQLKPAASAPKVMQNSTLKPHQPPRRPPAIQIPPAEVKPKPAHLPFILAFDSQVLATQLTLLEKLFLDELSWQSLLTSSWNASPAKPSNWVTYLQSPEGATANGIDLVTARFNLVSQWVVSEVLLTEDVRERARAVAKFIRIADACRTLRNYATVYQIVPSLLGSAISRLSKTWTLVSTAEKNILRNLETLCNPSRNFTALRAEMESPVTPTPSSSASGCIPLLALYTHDLTFNAQKPAYISAEPVSPMSPAADRPTRPAAEDMKEKLVNFDRYQTAAGITKGLLGLLERAGSYDIRPDWECLSRCFWLGALSEGEVNKMGRESSDE
ncbi:Guanine nucleotide exchange factor lte1 [Oleoguttula sp. CCFEE 5521]